MSTNIGSLGYDAILVSVGNMGTCFDMGACFSCQMVNPAPFSIINTPTSMLGMWVKYVASGVFGRFRKFLRTCKHGNL